MSASSRTMKGSDPPNSKEPFFIALPQIEAMSFPPDVLPTNLRFLNLVS